MDSEIPDNWKEGDLFAPLNKTIQVLIICNENYIVFLDEDFYVEWMEFEECDYPDTYSVIMDQVAYLETVSASHFAEPAAKTHELREIRRLLGEAVARVYDRDGEAAQRMVDSAAKLLTDRSSERARLWYLGAAGKACAPFCLLLVLNWTFRDLFIAKLGNGAFEITLCASMGAIGALVSVILRVRKVNLNASSGPTVHYLEGVSRIFVGCIGAMLVALAIKADLILGILATPNHGTLGLAILLALSIVAGASERAVPNLIQHLESSFSGSKSDGADTESV